MSNIEKLNKDAGDLAANARAFVITGNEKLQAAGEMLRGIKRLRAEVDAAFDPIIKRAHETHREAISQKKQAEGPLVDAESIIKGKICAYQAEEARKAAEEQARLRREAERLAEEAKLALALELEAAGETEAAEVALDAAPMIIVPVPAAPPKVAGVSTREAWGYNITDAAKIPREYLIPDLSKIGAVVRAMKGQTNIPGVSVYREDIVSARRF